MDKELTEVLRILQSICDFDVFAYDEVFLKRTAEKGFAASNVKDFFEYAAYLSANAEEAGALLQTLNVTHTEFFRNSLTFAHLEQWLLPRLIENKPQNGELRIWSAGCSTGQEAYSLAMLLENINASKQKKTRYRIIATDISQDALLAAGKGEYNEREIQRVRVKDLKEFFVKSGETYTVCDRLKQHVSFSFYDLLDSRSFCPQESIFGSFDLVLCCNLLFYYKPNYQRSILKKLKNSVAENGYLITGETESHTAAKYCDLIPVSPPSTIFKQPEV